MDSDGALCLPAFGICKAGSHFDLGALLFTGASGGLAPTSGASGTLGIAGAASHPEAAGSWERIELFGDLCRDAADGGHAVEGGGGHPFIFIDAVSLRLGNHVGVIA